MNSEILPYLLLLWHVFVLLSLYRVVYGLRKYESAGNWFQWPVTSYQWPVISYQLPTHVSCLKSHDSRHYQLLQKFFKFLPLFETDIDTFFCRFPCFAVFFSQKIVSYIDSLFSLNSPREKTIFSPLFFFISPIILSSIKSPQNKIKRKTRLELATICLASRCSTTELLPLSIHRLYS